MQPHDVLRVWIAMLAKADATGYVRASIPSMAHVCMIPIDRMEEIIGVLTSPDKYSRSPTDDGRRIRPVEGGFEIVNYVSYRNKRDEDERRRQNREAQRNLREGRKRAKEARCAGIPEVHADTSSEAADTSAKYADSNHPSARVSSVSNCQHPSAHKEAEAEAEEAKDEHPNGCLSPAAPPTDPADGDGDDPPGAPRCPVSRIVAEYHRVLPMLAPVRALPEQAARMLRARWRESAERQSVEWWTGFFEFVKRCPLLVGQVNDFQADLLWLVRPTNFAKTLNGNYERRSEG